MAIKARGFHTLAVVASPQAAYTLRLTELQWFKVVPSGTPSLFSNLRFPLLLYIGAKKAHFSPSMRMHLKRQYFRTDRAISSRQRLGTHPSRPVSTSSRCGRLEKTNDAALRSPLLNCDGLGIGIQRDPAGGVTKEFLYHLDTCPVCSEQ